MTPKILIQTKICIICEGYEEYEYLDKLSSLKVWDKKYTFALCNAKGNGNVFARYQEKYQSDSYDIVLIFCDTDRKPYEQYEDIKKKVNEFHGNELSAKYVIIYANPCTMQIIIQHFLDVSLKSHRKKKNAPYIQNATGIENYNAHDEQREELFSQINVSNYKDMVERVAKMNDDDKVVGSSNFIKFINNFSCSDCQWIIDTNKILETETDEL